MLRCLTSMETEGFVVIKHRLNSALNLNHGISEQQCVHHHKQHEAKYTLKTLNLFYVGAYFLLSPGNGKSGARLKCPVRKIHTVPMMNREMAAQKHTLSTIFPIKTQLSISLSWKESEQKLKFKWA